MKRPIEEHAARFDEMAASYDDQQNDTDEYRACVSLVVEAARAVVDEDATVLDLGCGTGAIALSLAEDAGRVIGRDISAGMLEEAREKAADAGLENVSFDEGRFREPNVDEDVDVVVSNFAMHHLADDEKRDALRAVAALDPDRFVLGDVMFFGLPDPDEPFYSPEVDDPATVGVLAEAYTDAGFALTDATAVHDQVGVLVGDDLPALVDLAGVEDGASEDA
ncbi:methyltransferase domain-containing protein [Halorubellus sp. JP-L1]|uniref:class I SAM-dependent methyltransferase n=1 Tax=Halorubellus sp. JP-L1 TaxID=2715753 RepID=UPI00140A0B94|nr:class I SAM-dependent methyltransferase [Halorubellus sp. JP-L1]NHN40314.1 methyltransferase domain-containing protein [Halorubellus sp. JP-L1]